MLPKGNQRVVPRIPRNVSRQVLCSSFSVRISPTTSSLSSTRGEIVTSDFWKQSFSCVIFFSFIFWYIKNYIFNFNFYSIIILKYLIIRNHSRKISTSWYKYCYNFIGLDSSRVFHGSCFWWRPEYHGNFMICLFCFWSILFAFYAYLV